jgi:hypothetical protein
VPDLALHEQRPSELERHGQALVLDERILDRGPRAVEVAALGKKETPRARSPDQGQRPIQLARLGLEALEEFLGATEFAQRDESFERLGQV